MQKNVICVTQMFVNKSCDILEVTCKIEISSIEEHIISLALYAAPFNSCEQVLPTSKQF